MPMTSTPAIIASMYATVESTPQLRYTRAFLFPTLSFISFTPCLAYLSTSLRTIPYFSAACHSVRQASDSHLDSHLLCVVVPHIISAKFLSICVPYSVCA